jgi:8-amino-7-oxononanoate synthase
VCGYTKHHEALEQGLAHLKKAETTLLFPTGYAANLAVLSSLADEATVVFTDILNHASIVDGGRLARQAGARVKVYRHRDANHLETLLKKAKEPRKLIVTDTVFSMDGDIAPLADLIALKRKYGALLVVDEAHGTLVFGRKGGGVTEALEVSQDIDIHVGTLSKAFGAQGGFVATNRRFRDWILNRGRSFVFSTALPVPVVAAASAALDVSTNDSSLRKSLWKHVAFLGRALGRTLESPIVPIVIGDNDRTLAASATLLDAGFHVPAIRPPTVPRGTSRLRVALSAAHSEEDVRALAQALRGI